MNENIQTNVLLNGVLSDNIDKHQEYVQGIYTKVNDYIQNDKNVICNVMFLQGDKLFYDELRFMNNKARIVFNGNYPLELIEKIKTENLIQNIKFNTPYEKYDFNFAYLKEMNMIIVLSKIFTPTDVMADEAKWYFLLRMLELTRGSLISNAIKRISYKNDRDEFFKETDKIKPANQLSETELKQRIATNTNRIQEYKNYIVNELTILERNKKDLGDLLTCSTQIIDKIKKDIALIAEHPMVEDIYISESNAPTRDGNKAYIINIQTKYMPVFDNKNKKYYEGNIYTIHIETHRNKMTFTGEKKYRGLWGSLDPHPHVNGNGGIGCLGNVEATIAELFVQNEIYALFTIGLNYLQVVNVEDSAGAQVVRRREVDKEGNTIRHAYSDSYSINVVYDYYRRGIFPNENGKCVEPKAMRVCPVCGNDYEENSGYDVYDEYWEEADADGNVIMMHGEMVEICQECYDEFADSVEGLDLCALNNNVEFRGER